MDSDSRVFIKCSPKGSRPIFVIYPVEVPNRLAETSMLKLSPAMDLLKVSASSIGSSEKSSIIHSPMLIISGIV